MAIKKINYNGSSKVIIRICEVVNDLIDRGSGGHTIQNSSGTDMTARTNLQFTGTSVSDDAVNDRTVVAVPTDVSAFNNDAGYLTSSDVGTAAAKDYTSSVTQNSGDLVTSGAVWTAIDNLPEPMIFKGTLGTGGTITTLPAASSSNQGFTYKVIEDGTYASQSAKVGDVFVSNGSEWVLIPSGDETFSDTWRGIQVNGTDLLGNSITTGKLNIKSGSNVTVSGSGNDVTISAQDTTYSDATQSASGLMSASDKTKLDGIASGAEVNVQPDWDEADNTADDYIKNKPTIPTVNDATLTLTQGGSTLGTFTANASSNVTIDVPSAGSPSASSVSYDNTVSGLTATDVQDAIDEVVGDIPTDFVPASTGGTFSGDVNVDKGSGTSIMAIGGASSKGNVNIYNNSGRYVILRYSDDATHNRAATFKDLNGQIVAASNFNNNFTADQTIDRQNGTTSAVGNTYLTIGNNIAQGTAKNSRGVLALYGLGSNYASILASNMTANRSLEFPDKDGTLLTAEDTEPRGSVSVTADGVKTASQLFDALYAIIDGSKIGAFSYLMLGSKDVLHIQHFESGDYRFAALSYQTFRTIRIRNSGSIYKTIGIGNDGTVVVTDNSSVVSNSGTVYKFVY